MVPTLVSPAVAISAADWHELSPERRSVAPEAFVNDPAKVLVVPGGERTVPSLVSDAPELTPLLVSVTVAVLLNVPEPIATPVSCALPLRVPLLGTKLPLVTYSVLPLETLSVLTPNGKYNYSATDHSGLTRDYISVNVVREGKLVPTDWAKEKLTRTVAGQ